MEEMSKPMDNLSGTDVRGLDKARERGEKLVRDAIAAGVFDGAAVRGEAVVLTAPELESVMSEWNRTSNSREQLCRMIEAAVLRKVYPRAADALDSQPTEAQADYAALRRTIHELRTYNPAADEYHGAHIHKGWANAIEAAICEPALLDAIKQLDSRASAAPAASVPDGWRLVPIESTGAMDIAGMESLGCDEAMQIDAERCYNAMLAAAPAPQQEGSEAGNG